MRISLLFLLAVMFFPKFIFGQTDSFFKITKIKIIGNKRTQEKVFLREWEYSEGDSFRMDKKNDILDTFQKRLSGILLFNYVRVYGETDTIYVEVSERVYSWGALRFGLADRNFFVWADLKDLTRVYYGARMNLNNISGLNKRLFVTFIYGYNRTFELYYHKPFNNYSNGWAWNVSLEYFWNREIWHKTINNTLQFLQAPDGKNVQERYLISAGLKKRINFFNRWEVEGMGRWISVEDTVISQVENPKYLLEGKTQSYYASALRFVSDHRIQRDYPVGGYLFSAEMRPGVLRSPGSMSFPVYFQLRASKFQRIFSKLYGVGYLGTQYFLGGDLPYQMTRQLGYRSDYVRGYEAYVADGRGLFLAKLGLRTPLAYQRLIKFGDWLPFRGARKIPFSFWFNIFADMGRVIQPTSKEVNHLADDWMNGVGCGLDVTLIYSALARFEISRSRIGETRFNISFLNAF